MQSAFHITSDSTRLHLPWTTQRPHSMVQSPKFRQRKLPQRHLLLSNSLKTSYGYEFEGIGREEEPATALRLPVVVRRSGRASRYFWDGTHLRLAIRDFFIPHQVHGHYIDYVKWKFLHRIFSSALQVLGTQAMFRAIGVGYSHSLPSAAALNWVLKDGLGRLSRCIYTASLASAFDTNLKRVRFSTSVLFTLSIGVELLTPAFPQNFLLLATVANIAKQISLACYLATGSAVHQSFAIADNLGEVSAKAQIQTVCFDNIGLMLAALLNILCKNSQRLQACLPFVVYPVFSTIDLFGIYRGLKHVHLQTLTKDRLEIILSTWIELGFIPSPAEVSKEEGMDFPWSRGRKSLPVRVGCVDLNDPIPKLSMLTMKSLKREDFYFICLETSIKGLSRNVQQGILVCLREGAGTTDIIMGLLQACHIRKALLLNKSRWEHLLELGDPIDSVVRDWFKVVEDSRRYLQEDVHLLKEEMSRSGWAVKNVLLNLQEQVRYSLLDDRGESCGLDGRGCTIRVCP